MYVVVPLMTVGVPVTCPEDALKFNPAGRVGDTVNVRVPNPPVAVTGVKGVAAVFWVSVVDATAWVVTSAGNASTVRLNVLELVCAGLLESVTVTVKVVADRIAVGVPEISPEAVFNDRPTGRLGEILNARFPVPPVAVTGVKGVACILCVSIFDATACTVTIGLGSTVSWNVRLLVWLGLLESTTVIVCDDAALGSVGVPDMVPVAALNVNPAGRAGLMRNVSGKTPPAVVTGAKAVTAVPTFSVLVATASVVVSSLLSVITERLKLALAVCPSASVKVTTKLVFDNISVGVPVMVTSTKLYNLET